MFNYTRYINIIGYGIGLGMIAIYLDATYFNLYYPVGFIQ